MTEKTVQPTLGRIIHVADRAMKTPVWYAAIVTKPVDAEGRVWVKVFNPSASDFNAIATHVEGKPLLGAQFIWKWPDRV